MAPQDGQAGAEIVLLGARPLRSKESLGLRFEICDDALRYAEKIAQTCLDARRKAEFFGIDHVLMGNSVIRFEISPPPDPREFDLVITLYPHKLNWLTNDRVVHDKGLDDPGHSDDPLMLPRGGDFSQYPERLAFPVFVWFDRAAEVQKGRVDVSAPFFDLTFEIGDGFPNGEIEVFGVRASKIKRGVANGLIQCMPKVGGCVGGELPRFGRYPFWRADLEHALSGLRINVRDDVRGIHLPEGQHCPIVFSKAFLCGCDKEFGAFE